MERLNSLFHHGASSDRKARENGPWRGHTHTSIFDGKISVLEYISIMCLTKPKSCIILLVEQRASSKLVVASHT